VYTAIGATYSVHNVFQEVADRAILARGMLGERGERYFKTRLFHELEQLTLGCTGIAKQQNVDVTP